MLHVGSLNCLTSKYSHNGVSSNLEDKKHIFGPEGT